MHVSKKILIIDGHPDQSSLIAVLAKIYQEKALNSGHQVKRINVRDLEFDYNLKREYKESGFLEDCLIEAQKQILWCEHLVVAYPVWWGSMPACLKAFFDRVFLAGFAFRYHQNDPFWDELLSGRSARVIATSGAPYLYLLIRHFGAQYRVVKNTILRFSGFKPVKLTPIGKAKQLSQKRFLKIKAKIEKLAELGI